MQRGGNNAAEEYDLEGVTARLEAMRTRREMRQGGQSGGMGLQLDRKPAGGFDLAPAELSSGGSDDDESSSGGCRSGSTSSLPSDDERATSTLHRSKGREKARKLRVVDSLDLSMSVSAFEGGQGSVDPTRSSRAKERSSSRKLPDGKSGGRLQTSSKHDGHIQPILDEQARCTDAWRSSRIPRLVQRRRQIQASEKRADELNVQDSSSVVTNNGKGRGEHSSSSSECPDTHKRSNQARFRHSTQPEPNHTMKIRDGRVASLKTQYHPDDIDATTAEERQLLESLEKLNQRLTNVNTSAAPASKTGHHERRSELPLSGSDPLASTISSAACAVTSEVYHKTLRAAAYGGGAHCKLRQPASASLRSSSVRRAELSGGVHKARVRIGGAFVHEGARTSSTDGNGKHKIVVKKELAHLLF
ncbi:unnamed protein product [Phytophthora fragariaefolia]|uniref:Unnamed protein product n=1 Tax=Phytophthora fragariaefolia TaxID=1490495 RepID=A0A9W7D179_9STRA|nr:unnamed protein product [Phytophthora fragariaefolia]